MHTSIDSRIVPALVTSLSLILSSANGQTNSTAAAQTMADPAKIEIALDLTNKPAELKDSKKEEVPEPSQTLLSVVGLAMFLLIRRKHQPC